MIIDTVCRLCSSCCPIEAEVEGDRLIGARRKSFLDPDKRLPCPKGLFANYMDKISLRFGSDLVVAISAKPQA